MKRNKKKIRIRKRKPPKSIHNKQIEKIRNASILGSSPKHPSNQSNNQIKTNKSHVRRLIGTRYKVGISCAVKETVKRLLAVMKKRKGKEKRNSKGR